ncbi:MAG: hypothetical protein ACRC17_06420 [Culicoidibacterales bacterium]
MKKRLAVLAGIGAMAMVGVIGVSANVDQPTAELQPTSETVAIDNDGNVVESDWVASVEVAEDGSLILTDKDGNVIVSALETSGSVDASADGSEVTGIIGEAIATGGAVDNDGNVVESDWVVSSEVAEDGSLILTDKDGNVIVSALETSGSVDASADGSEVTGTIE